MPKVKTTKLTGVPKTKTVNRGKKPSPSKPLQHQEILMRRSLIDHPTKKVATVTSKGVVKGIRKGTATITVQSGSKKSDL